MELACHYHAVSRVGGDFYDVFYVGGDTWAFFLGDVQGHGVEAAVVTSHIRYALRAAGVHHSDPADALAELNWSLLQDPAAGRFCTVVFGLMEPDRFGDGWHILLGTGGHPPALWIRPTEGTVTPVQPVDGMLVGAFADATFSQCSLHLRQGETLLLHTDGLTEGGRGGPLAAENDLTVQLEVARPQGAQAAVRLIEAMLYDVVPTDDVAVLAMSPVEPPTLRT